MKKTLPIFSILMVYLTEVAAYCNLMMFFSSTKANNYAYVEMWPWLALCTLFFLGLHWFLQGQRTLEQMVAVVAVSTVGILVIMSLLYIHVVTLLGWGFAWSLIAISVIRGAFLLLRGCDTHLVLLGCELPLAGIGFLLWMDACQVYYLPPYYIVCTMAVLLLNLVGLSLARMYSINGAGGMNNGAVVTTATVSFGVLGGISALFVRFAAGSASATVGKTAELMGWVYTWVTTVLMAILNWFLSLFPVPEYDSMDMESQESYAADLNMEEMQEMNPQVLVIAGLVVVAVIVFFIVRLFLKMRKLRMTMKGRTVQYHRPHQRVEKQSLWKRFLAFLRRCYGRVAFSVAVFCKRNTPQGTMLVLLRLGKQRGLAKETGESYGGYLNRLSQACHSVDPHGAELMQGLAVTLDGALYGAEPVQATFTVGQYRTMRHTLQKLPIKVRKVAASS